MRKSDVVYCGVFFKSVPFEGKLCRPIVHPHVTHMYRPWPSDIHPEFFGKEVQATVFGYGNDSKNEGVLVSLHCDDPDLSKALKSIVVPHITISVGRDGHPVDTGRLTFEQMPQMVTLIGRYGAFCNDNNVYYALEEE